MRLFADDCILYKVVNNTADCVKLQDDIDQLDRWGRKWQMQFNAKKCYVMNMGTKRQKLSFDSKLHGQTLDTVDHHQYLGVFLSHKFKWDFQFNHIAKKANQVLGMLRRNLRGCSRSIKSTAYLGLVRPNLEYASSVCDPHESKYINKLEMIQRKAARFVCNNYDRHASVTNMLNDLGWDTLEHRRKAARLVQMKLIQMGDSAIPKTMTPLATDRSRRSRTGNSQRLHQTYCRTDAYRYSFLPWTCRDWNKLPDSIINSTSIDNFKSQVLDYIRHTSP